jgi:hypothetical protein
MTCGGLHLPGPAVRKSVPSTEGDDARSESRQARGEVRVHGVAAYDGDGGVGARGQGLTLVHVRAQLEQLQDTFMS